jgi:hypothetical protein
VDICGGHSNYARLWRLILCGLITVTSPSNMNRPQLWPTNSASLPSGAGSCQDFSWGRLSREDHKPGGGVPVLPGRIPMVCPRDRVECGALGGRNDLLSDPRIRNNSSSGSLPDTGNPLPLCRLLRQALRTG